LAFVLVLEIALDIIFLREGEEERERRRERGNRLIDVCLFLSGEQNLPKGLLKNS
jgi:hypothetical protein